MIKTQILWWNKKQQNAQKKYTKALRNIFYELAQLTRDVMI